MNPRKNYKETILDNKISTNACVGAFFYFSKQGGEKPKQKKKKEKNNGMPALAEGQGVRWLT